MRLGGDYPRNYTAHNKPAAPDLARFYNQDGHITVHYYEAYFKAYAKRSCMRTTTLQHLHFALLRNNVCP